MSTATIDPVQLTSLPARSSIRDWRPNPFLADAFEVALPADASGDPEQLARFMFGHQPRWITLLLKLRDTIVAGFGLKTAAELRRMRPAPTPGGAAPGARVDIFRIYAIHPDEIVLGEDDKHLDFRLSLLLETRLSPAGPTRHLIASTIVHCHNTLGRNYIRLIAPFHRAVVRSTLRRGALLGWPKAGSPPGPLTARGRA